MKYQVAQYSLVGGRRSNQDRVTFAERANAVLLAVADGLGGHAGGELAAQIAVDIAVRAFQAVKQPIIEKPFGFLALAMEQAHKAMIAAGARQIPAIKPRTTLVLCLVQNGYAYWAHVGDSRLYHFRDKQLITRTLDHTSIEQLQMDGLLTEEEMHTHPGKASLLKCLGGNTRPSVSVGRETLLYRNDVLLLCSDGLWEAFTPEEMTPYLDKDDLETGLEELLLDAEEKMGRGCDNTSAVCLRWTDGVTSSLPLERHAPASGPLPSPLAIAVKARARQATRKPIEEPSLDDSLKELESLLKRYGPKT